jgi:outer membrane protein assembly factor BamD
MKFIKILPALIALTFLLLTAACDTPEKLLKSTDLDYKHKKAMQWYNKKQYYKCIPVFEELMGLYKGTKSTEEIYYYYCLANFKQGDYIISAYHLKNFYDLYPSNEHADECLYLHAKSYEKLSPTYELEQTYTYKALEAYMLYMSNFYDPKRTDSCNMAIAKMRKKLEKKALSNAELYYKIGHYRAAATTFEQLLETYPDIDNTERIYFMIVKANQKFAHNSIPSKKAERYSHVIDSYITFKKRFPASKFMEEASEYEQQAQFQTVKGLLEHGQTAALGERERIFNKCIYEAGVRKNLITDLKIQAKCDAIAEHASFLIVKNHFLIAEEMRGIAKSQPLEQTVKSYVTFAAQFKDSKYAREADKMYRTATKTLEKLKENG